MMFNVSFTIKGSRNRSCVEYARTPDEAARRALRSICKAYHCAETDVNISKVKKRSG